MIMPKQIVNKLIANQNCFNYYFCFKNVYETDGIDSGIGKSVLYVLIGNCMNENKAISTICKELLQKITEVTKRLL